MFHPSEYTFVVTVAYLLKRLARFDTENCTGMWRISSERNSNNNDNNNCNNPVNIRRWSKTHIRRFRANFPSPFSCRVISSWRGCLRFRPLPHHPSSSFPPSVSLFLFLSLCGCSTILCFCLSSSPFGWMQSIRHSWRDGYGWWGREHRGQRPAPWISFDRLHIGLVHPRCVAMRRTRACGGIETGHKGGRCAATHPLRLTFLLLSFFPLSSSLFLPVFTLHSSSYMSSLPRVIPFPVFISDDLVDRMNLLAIVLYPSVDHANRKSFARR